MATLRALALVTVGVILGLVIYNECIRGQEIGAEGALPVRFVYVVPSDLRDVRYPDAAGLASFAHDAENFQTMVERNTGYTFPYTLDYIPTAYTLAELATDEWGVVRLDACGQGVWENTLYRLVVFPYLKAKYGDHGMPFFTETPARRDYRLVIQVEGAGGYAGGRTAITPTENAGEALVGTWRDYAYINGVSDPCALWKFGPDSESDDVCHEALHGFGVVDKHAPYINRCTDPFDQSQHDTLLSNSALWLEPLSPVTDTPTVTPRPVTPTPTMTPRPVTVTPTPCPPGWLRNRHRRCG